ncbi:MAG: radical SAM protein [Candidatus Aegiribacteria sp.]|nr:radical SAM protein [Candidatus Aegiribacteria sp.]MBD3294712.1 radical SAM protein [Candidatus Fermentibacteria bacterium]
MKLGGQIKMGLNAALGLFGRRRPVNVMVSITDKCCSRCSYCQIPEQGRPDLSTKQWKDLFRQMAEAGTRRIGVWGGEPLMRKDICELCGYARSLGMYVSLDSNGYIIPSRLEILDNIDHLVLAYDGPEHAHDANREEGSHEKALRAMEAVSGRVRFWTITVLTRNNIHHLDSIMETALKYGFQTTFQTLHHNEKLGGDTSGMMPSREEYAKTYDRLLKMKRDGAPIANSTRYLKSLMRWPDYSVTRMEEKFHGVPCRAGSMYCNIDADGKVYPCSLLIGLYPDSVNALETGFREAFRKTHTLPCQACTASCYTEYNYLYSLDPVTALQWHRSVKETDRMMKSKSQDRNTGE